MQALVAALGSQHWAADAFFDKMGEGGVSLPPDRRPEGVGVDASPVSRQRFGRQQLAASPAEGRDTMREGQDFYHRIQPLPEISDRVHETAGYPNCLHDRGNGHWY